MGGPPRKHEFGFSDTIGAFIQGGYVYMVSKAGKVNKAVLPKVGIAPKVSLAFLTPPKPNGQQSPYRQRAVTMRSAMKTLDPRVIPRNRNADLMKEQIQRSNRTNTVEGAVPIPPCRFAISNGQSITIIESNGRSSQLETNRPDITCIAADPPWLVTGSQDASIAVYGAEKH